MIPETFIDELLGRVDIVELIGRYVPLRKTGANHSGLCPFHAEKSPSFTVSASKQFFHCFGCGAHGHAIRFLMEHNGMGFVDAIRELSGQVGLNVPELDDDPAERARMVQQRERQASLGSVLERAAQHYQAQLKGHAQAVDYLKRRGLSGNVARDFGIGYAPDSWRGLASAFPRYDDPLLAESGLVIVNAGEGQDEKRYDRFRGRIMFPIRSVRGEVIGFGGRVLDTGEPKYLNSPETPLFVKGRELYGLFEARQAIRERGHALVVEGYMDVVALAQHGIGNAVATLGTACTGEHVAKLLRFTDSVVFSFDGDAAGRRAASRAMVAALPHAGDTRRFSFLFLPSEHDPDSFVREQGQAAFEQALASALSLSAQFMAVAAEGCDLALPEGRARMLAQARALWAQLPQDGLLRRQMLAELATAAQLATPDLAEAWGLNTPQRRSTAPKAINASPPARLRNRPAGPADHALRMLLLHNDWWHNLGPEDQELLHRLPGEQGELCAWLERQLHEHGPQPWGVLQEALAGETISQMAQQVMQSIAAGDASDFQDLRAVVNQLLREQLVQRSNELAVLATHDPQARAQYAEVLTRIRNLRSAAA